MTYNKEMFQSLWGGTDFQVVSSNNHNIISNKLQVIL